jgi:hypothetical protein
LGRGDGPGGIGNVRFEHDRIHLVDPRELRLRQRIELGASHMDRAHQQCRLVALADFIQQTAPGCVCGLRKRDAAQQAGQQRCGPAQQIHRGKHRTS